MLFVRFSFYKCESHLIFTQITVVVHIPYGTVTDSVSAEEMAAAKGDVTTARKKKKLASVFSSNDIGTESKASAMQAKQNKTDKVNKMANETVVDNVSTKKQDILHSESVGKIHFVGPQTKKQVRLVQSINVPYTE